MEFQDVVRRRRMVRSFEPRPISPDVVDRILENALHAPSAGFTQGWAFLVLQGRDDTERFWNATWERADARAAFRYQSLFNAPLIIVALSNEDAYLDRYAEADKGWTDRDPGRWPVPYWHVDTGFAALLMLMTAVDAGLGGLFFSVAEPERVRAIFGIPDGFTPVGALAIGYPAADEISRSVARGRRSVEQVVHRGDWGKQR
jgi:nitroreductase